MSDLGDHDFGVIGLADQDLDALHDQQVPAPAQVPEVAPDGLAAVQFGGLPRQAERIGEHAVLGEQVGEFHASDLVSDAKARADAADPGEAFFGFLTRIAGEAAAKRDLPDAISIAGSLREDLFAALDLLLRRAQQAGAVRAGFRTPDLIVLLKGMFASLADSADPGLHERVFAVLADGLRPPRPRT